jgi:hypothetical protein
MEFIKFIFVGGFGGVIGAVIIKVLDIVWLQRTVYCHELNRWKRDKKFVVYSKVARDLISQEGWGREERSPELYALIGEAALLIEDKTLTTRLDLFYKATFESLKKSSGIRQDAEHYGDEGLIEDATEFHKSRNNKFQNQAREILVMLQKDLLI